MSKALIIAISLAALALAANVTVTTPSGTIHIIYVDNNTKLIINFNNKVLTVNLETKIINNSQSYYIHIVGEALAQTSFNYTRSQILEILGRVANATNSLTVINSLVQLGKLLSTSNETKKLEVNVKLSAKALNATKPNATYLKMKLEYELKKMANGTKKELEVEIKGADLNKAASILEAIARRFGNSTEARMLLYVANELRNMSPAIKKEVEVYVNGTKIEVEVKKGKVEVEIEHKKGGHKKSGSSDEDKSKTGSSEKSKVKKSEGKSKKSEDDEGKSKSEEKSKKVKEKKKSKEGKKSEEKKEKEEEDEE